MACPACGKREKLFEYRVKGHQRPFVDKDLQLRLPGLESSVEHQNFNFYHRIYSHYSSSLSPHSYPLSLVNESELYSAMEEAQKTHESWKKMRQQLQDRLQRQ